MVLAKAWKGALVASGLWSCALGFGYGDYERASGDVGGSGGSGGGGGTDASAGTGGAFPTGGTDAGDGESGGSGGAGGTAGSTSCVNDDGCPPDTDCADWFCKDTCQVTVATMGTSCGEPPACINTVLNASTCQGMECETLISDCDPASCSTAGCCLTCAEKVKNPQLGYIFCTIDEQNRWNTLVTCCDAPCKATCVDSATDVVLICGGTSTEAPSAACLNCIASACPSPLNTCNTPTN